MFEGWRWRQRLVVAWGWLFALNLGFLVLACAKPVAKGPQVAEPLRVVRAQVDAFNRRDVAAPVAGVAPDFKWLSVDAQQTVTEVEGPEALRTSMVDYFVSMPTVRSSIEEVFVEGDFVAVRERVSWETAKGLRSQSALAVYGIRAGKIFRVWYYPAQH